VEEIRRAAALMRERAQAATPGPWRVGPEGSEGSYLLPSLGGIRERSRFIGILNGRVQPEDGHNAAHVASWHPVVALAVADWLDGTADATESEPEHYPVDLQALAVARAYLAGERP
jgi:hypothetical protein